MRSGTRSPIVWPIAARHVQADEVEQRKRPHRVAGAESHARVDSGRVDVGLFEQPHGAEQVREQQPVDDEPGHVGHLDRCLLERRRTAPVRAAASLRARGGREDQLDQLHPRHRVEHVQPDEPLRDARSPSPAARSTARRSCWRGSPAGRARRSSSASSPALTSWSSTTASTTNVACAKRLAVGHDLHVLGVDLGAQAAEGPLDRCARPSAESSRAGQQQHRAVMGGGRRQPAGDRAAAGYCQRSVISAGLSSFRSLVAFVSAFVD